MAFVIAEPCIGTKDTACVAACPVDCIQPEKRHDLRGAGRPSFDEVAPLYTDPVECIDCGACVPACPAWAMFAIDDLPEVEAVRRNKRQLRTRRQISHPMSTPSTRRSRRGSLPRVAAEFTKHVGNPGRSAASPQEGG
jgi:ferredoxin